MSGFTGIQVSLFLKLLLHLTAVSGQDFSSFAVRVGAEVALPCMYDQVKCDSTIWIFTHSLYPTVELVVQGKIGEDAKSKSDRLSVTENCSLVIKNVTAADGGLYTCRQFKSGEQQDPDQSQVDLSVVTMTEQKVDDEVVLFCSVFTYQQCSYTVQWLPTGTDVDKDHTAVGTSQSDCLATVAFRTLHHNQSNYHQLLKCEVRNRDGGNMQLFAFSLQSTGEVQRNNTTSREFNATTQEEQCRYTVQWLYEDGKGDSTSVETTSTTCSARVSFNTSHLHHKSKYKESVKCEVTDTHSRTLQLFNFTPQSSPEKTAEPNGNRPTPEQVPGWWWLFVGAAVVLAALLMIAVVVIRWKKTKGNKTQLDDNTRLSLNPAATQPGAEAGPDVTDPEDGVSYASISYTQRTNGKDKVQVKDDDDAVTYSAVKTPSSSAGASTDPSSIYASVNKPNKSEATV